MVRRNAGNDVKRASLFFVTLTRSVRIFVQPWGAPTSRVSNFGSNLVCVCFVLLCSAYSK